MDEDPKIIAIRTELSELKAKRAAWANGMGSSDPSEFHRISQKIAENEQMLKDLGAADA